MTMETVRPPAILVADEDVRQLVRDLERDGFQVTDGDIRDILEVRSRGANLPHLGHSRESRLEEMRRRLADAVKDVPAPPAPAPFEFAPRRGAGKRGQRAAARARRGAW